MFMNRCYHIRNHLKSKKMLISQFVVNYILLHKWKCHIIHDYLPINDTIGIKLIVISRTLPECKIPQKWNYSLSKVHRKSNFSLICLLKGFEIHMVLEITRSYSFCTIVKLLITGLERFIDECNLKYTQCLAEMKKGFKP